MGDKCGNECRLFRPEKTSDMKIRNYGEAGELKAVVGV